MTADVLLYNALNETNKRFLSDIAAVDSLIAAQNSTCSNAIAGITTAAVEKIGFAGPNQANLWCLIPEGTNWTTGFKVCDTSGNFRCGACCAWTVPNGVTCARFQLWGAGAGTGSACCCGFSPIGGVGAYASVIIPVTPGDTYTLCAGCAFCCYANRAQNDVDGCPSYVTGTGLTNFCAEGGEGSIFCEVRTRGQAGAQDPLTYCRYLAGWICNTGSDVCWEPSSNGVFAGSPSCCFDNLYPMIASCKTYYGTATCGTVYGIRGSFGSIALNCNGTICVRHPPIYGFASSSCCTCLITTVQQQGCLRSANQGFMQIPAAGGWAGFKCGGQTDCNGDAGRMGMVCVSYK